MFDFLKETANKKTTAEEKTMFDILKETAIQKPTATLIALVGIVTIGAILTLEGGSGD